MSVIGCQNKLKKNRILIAGDIMLDIYSFGKVNRISPEAPVPVLLKKEGQEIYSLGGAANVAVNLIAAGANVDLATVIGEDTYGEILLEKLNSIGISTKYICKNYRCMTTTKLRYIAQNNQQLLRVDVEDNRDVELEIIKDKLETLEKNIHQYNLLILSDYQKGFLSLEVVQRLISAANAHNIPVLVDVKDKQFEKYKGAFLLKPNRKELENLTNMSVENMKDIIEASCLLCRKAESKYVLTTLSMDGLVLVDGQGLVLHVKSMAHEVFDVTGAGDTFIAYLGAGLAGGSDILEAVRMANYAAGVQVSKIGTSVVYPNEVLAAMGKKVRHYRDKFIDINSLNGISHIKAEKLEGKKIVFTNGCFDILHAGHVTYLEKAAKLGDLLIVGVNSDSSVKRLKGDSRPINKLEDRLIILSSLEFVDYVIPFEDDTPINLIEMIKPDVLVKGGDYQIADIVGAKSVQNSGGTVVTIPLLQGRSTTDLVNRMSDGVTLS